MATATFNKCALRLSSSLSPHDGGWGWGGGSCDFDYVSFGQLFGWYDDAFYITGERPRQVRDAHFYSIDIHNFEDIVFKSGPE